MYYAFGYGLIELSQMILARSEHTHTQFARRQQGVMARSLIIALAHRQRQPERQAGAPLILIEIDSFSRLRGEGEGGRERTGSLSYTIESQKFRADM